MSDTAILALCPAKSGHTTIGPAMRVGGTVVHYVKNAMSLRYYRLGARETYLLSLMDGVRSLGAIAADYQVKFGRPLGVTGLRQILQMLGSRGLLAMPDQAPEQSPDRSLDPSATASAQALPRLSVKRWGEVYFRLVNPDRLLALIVRRLAWINGSVATWCIVTLIGLCELYAVVNHAALGAEISRSIAHPAPLLIALFCAFTYGGAVIHELAHGTLCARYGGRVDDMGLMFRYMMLFPYCKLDDLVVLPSAKARRVVVLAGVTANLLLLVPFALLDIVIPGDGLVKQLCAYVLVFYNLSVLVNLLPFLRFDGYMLLSVCQGRPELKEEAFGALRTLFSARRAAQGHDWPLLTYGLAYALVTVAAVAGALYQWVQWTTTHGQAWAAFIAPLLVLGVIVFNVRRPKPVALGQAVTG